MFEEKDIQFLDKTAKAFLSIVKKIVKNYSYSKTESYSKAEVDSAVSTGTAGLYSIRGSWDASGGLFPTTGGRGIGGLPKAGDGWNISVAGIMGGKLYSIGDGIVALIDTPAQTAANWEDAEGNLGFTPENSSNKENTTLDTSTSKYPTNRLVKEAVDTKQATLTATIFGTFISAFTAKTTPVDADEMNLTDSVASGIAKKVTWANVKATLKTYFDTLYQTILSAANFGDFIVALTGKATPVNADAIVITDSEATDDAKKVTLTNFKAFLKTYFDTLYAAIGGSGITVVTKQIFTGNGTYTPTAGMVYCIVEAWGGGGAGGSIAGSGSFGGGGGGGGAGGYSRSVIAAATIGASKAVVIGAAGAAAAAGNNAGGNGGDTTLGTTIVVAKGGSGGGGSAGSSAVGGAGGVAGTGDIAAVGMNGFSSFSTNASGSGSGGGAGASTLVGSGGLGSIQTSATAAAAGNAGVGYGAGGSGAIANGTGTTAAGGAGTVGYMIITEFK